MKAKIEKHIGASVVQIQRYFDANHGHPIKKEYKSYLSSLGASLIMSGLLPTLAVYYADKSKADRPTVIEWVFNIIKSYRNCSGSSTLLDYALSLNETQRDVLMEEIKDISVALKLSIRTFPLTK